MVNNVSLREQSYSKTRVSQVENWQEAILYAQRLLVDMKKREANLRSAIRVFHENLQSGEVWPGHDSVFKEEAAQR